MGTLQPGCRNRIYTVWSGDPVTREVTKLHTFVDLKEANKYAKEQTEKFKDTDNCPWPRVAKAIAGWK